MIISIVPTQDDVFKTLGTFIASVLAPGIPVRQGQVSRVSEPHDVDFVEMWPILFPRIATNLNDCFDSVFTGSIAASVLTITAVNPNWNLPLVVGRTIFGVGVADDTVITSFISGNGGVGTYGLNKPQTISSRVIAAGIQEIVQAAEAIVQIDVHGPNSSNNAQIISTLFRDPFAVGKFQEIDANVTPLYTDDPRQSPFHNAEQQYEDRFIITAHMQVNQTVTVPQQFADQLVVDLKNVDVVYPPT